MRVLGLGVLVVLLCNFSQTAAAQEQSHRPWRKVWALSAAALAAGTAFDAASSVNRFETNPLLRNSQGRFSGTKGIALKSLIAGGTLGVQALLMRKRPEARLEKPCALVNFAAAGVLTGVAVRNRATPLASGGGQ